VRERLEGLGYVGAGGESTPADELWDFSRRDPKDVIEVFNEFQKLVVSKLDGKSGEAQALLDDVLQRDPENPRLLQMLAGLQVEAEDWAGAREICRRIVALDPETASAWRTLGVASLRLGDTGEALRSFGRAVEIEPDDAATWTTLATLHTEQGDVSEAIAAYDRVLAIDPGRAAAVSERALLLARAGRPREAVDALRGVLAQDPDDLDALNNLAWILTSESLDPDEGFRHAQRAAQLAPDDPVVLDTLGWAAIRSGRPAEAVSPLTTAWKATGDAEVRAHLGIALAESGKTDEGAAHVRAALRERPSLAEIPEARKWNR
jgi:tetratricopeptide (TPR) repeat protein